MKTSFESTSPRSASLFAYSVEEMYVHLFFVLIVFDIAIFFELGFINILRIAFVADFAGNFGHFFNLNNFYIVLYLMAPLKSGFTLITGLCP
jgi:hypothetical protein